MLYVSHKSQYNLENSPFAAGGEGNIHNILDNSSFIAKLYHQDKRTREKERKIETMMQFNQNLPPFLNDFTWPKEILYDSSGKFAGYIMPKIQNRKSLQEIYIYGNRINTFEFYVKIALNLCATVNNIHNINQIIGDLNPKNILVNNNAKVIMIDTDSYQIINPSKLYFRCNVAMPEFTAPELQGKHYPSEPLPTFTKESDRFSLAILLFRILMNGAHPFACVSQQSSISQFQPIDNIKNGICPYFLETNKGHLTNPPYAPDLSIFPTNIKDLFRSAFVDGNKNPSMRPTAKMWHTELTLLRKNLKVCSRNTNHIFYNQNITCPWCDIEKKMKKANQRTYAFSYDNANNTSKVFNSIQNSKHAQNTLKNTYTSVNQTTNTKSEFDKFVGGCLFPIVFFIIMIVVIVCIIPY